MQRGKQHGSRKYDDLQNLLDMMSCENPLLSITHILVSELKYIFSLTEKYILVTCAVNHLWYKNLYFFKT